MNRYKKLIMNKTLYGMAMVLLFWYLMYILIDSPAIPSPLKAFINFIEIFPKVLSKHLIVSLGRIGAAIGISLLLGSILGIFIGMSKKAEELISPVVYILYPLPKIAFLPILMILFGLGNTPKIMLIIFIIIFQFILAARDGIKEIPKELFYSINSLALTKRQVYWHMVVPSVFPKVITALRNSIGVSIAVLFFAENFATTYGIGYFIMNSWAMVNYVEMFSGIIALSLFGLILFKLIDFLEEKLCPWIRLRRDSMLQGLE